jgi:hypothetical protein
MMIQEARFVSYKKLYQLKCIKRDAYLHNNINIHPHVAGVDLLEVQFHRFYLKTITSRIIFNFVQGISVEYKIITR